MTAPTLAAMVKELCESSKQRTRRPDGAVEWVVSAPSLIDQLSSLEPSSGAGARRGFASRPAANLEAIDHAKTINAQARAWARWLGIGDTGRPGAVIRRVYGQTPQLEELVVDQITNDVRRWWVGARILSGWDTASFKPANHCPEVECGEYGTLRINVADRLACCINCKASWDSATLGVLAQWIRHENDDEAA